MRKVVDGFIGRENTAKRLVRRLFPIFLSLFLLLPAGAMSREEALATLAANPGDVAALNVLSRIYSDAIAAAPTEAEKKAAARQSLDYALRAVAAGPHDAGAHVSLAVAYGKMTDFTDNKTKIAWARRIKSEAETGRRLDPKNDDACHVLARWNDEMSRLNPVLRSLARVMYGKLPEASASEAEKLFREAIRLAPRKILHHADLARFYQYHGNRDRACSEWQAVLDLPAVDAEDHAYQNEARRFLK